MYVHLKTNLRAEFAKFKDTDKRNKEKWKKQEQKGKLVIDKDKENAFWTVRKRKEFTLLSKTKKDETGEGICDVADFQLTQNKDCKGLVKIFIIRLKIRKVKKKKKNSGKEK